MFLIVGGDSEIGAALAAQLEAQDRPVAATTRRPERAAPNRPLLDLAAPLDSWTPPPSTRAACMCAAVARLAACAADPQGSARINVDQSLALVDTLLAQDIAVLFLSTNQVFDGGTPNVVADAPHSPVSEYGRQKAKVEAALRQRIGQGAPAAILRLAKVVSPGMPLLRGWIADLKAQRPIHAFADMTLAPTPAALVCDAIAALLEDRARGIFQLTGPRDVSYAEVGRFIAAYIGAENGLVQETSAYDSGLPQGAAPLHTTLDSSLLRERYSIAAPDVWEVVESVILSDGEPP